MTLREAAATVASRTAAMTSGDPIDFDGESGAGFGNCRFLLSGMDVDADEVMSLLEMGAATCEPLAARGATTVEDACAGLMAQAFAIGYLIGRES